MKTSPAGSGPKSLAAAYALLLAFGPLGAHRFYLSRPTSGGLQALLSLVGIGALFSLLGDYGGLATAIVLGETPTHPAHSFPPLSVATGPAQWAAAGCLAAIAAWLAGDFFTMPFWAKNEKR